MLAHDRLLDIVENFILFDDSKPGATRKVIARNHQVLGVNRAVASVARQEELKLEYPPEQRLRHRVVKLPLEPRAPAENLPTQRAIGGCLALHSRRTSRYCGAGASRPRPAWRILGTPRAAASLIPWNSSPRSAAEAGRQLYLLVDDRPKRPRRPDLQTFVGCSIADNQTPRAASGDDLEKRLKENHRYVFSLIHKFNKDVDPEQPYTERVRHHRDLGRGSPHPGRTACAQHAPSRCRTRPSSASPARPFSSRISSQGESLGITCLATISSGLRRRQHRQAGLRESRRKTGCHPD